jgi:glycosyltransferase involved in cell wall biosynthesis
MRHSVSVAVFCQNEAARIGACIASIAAAAKGLRCSLTIIVNGSTDASAELARQAVRAHALNARVYTIGHGDKANAINRSFHDLREPADLHVFLDGYVVIAPESLRALGAALDDYPHAVAATGVAGNGRTMRASTAQTLRHGGQLHGQLHAFRPGFIDRLTAAGLRLPIGLYRGDGLLGSMACHDLDPRGTAWDGHRIRGAAAARYEIPLLSPFKPADVARQFRRQIRQMRGRLENAAISSTIYKGGYQDLPPYADDMIAGWLANGGRPRAGLLERPFMQLAMRHHARSGRPTEDALRPVLSDA